MRRNYINNTGCDNNDKEQIKFKPRKFDTNNHLSKEENIFQSSPLWLPNERIQNFYSLNKDDSVTKGVFNYDMILLDKILNYIYEETRFANNFKSNKLINNAKRNSMMGNTTSNLGNTNTGFSNNSTSYDNLKTETVLRKTRNTRKSLKQENIQLRRTNKRILNTIRSVDSEYPMKINQSLRNTISPGYKDRKLTVSGDKNYENLWMGKLSQSERNHQDKEGYTPIIITKPKGECLKRSISKNKELRILYNKFKDKSTQGDKNELYFYLKSRNEKIINANTYKISRKTGVNLHGAFNDFLTTSRKVNIPEKYNQFRSKNGALNWDMENWEKWKKINKNVERLEIDSVNTILNV